MKNLKIWRRVLATVLALIIVCGVSLNAKAGTTLYWITNQALADNFNIFVYSIGDIVYPGGKLGSNSEKNMYYFMDDPSLTYPDSSTFCDANGIPLNTDDFRNAYMTLLSANIYPTTPGANASDYCTSYNNVASFTIPAAHEGYVGWELKLITKSASIDYWFFPYKVPENPPTPGPTPTVDARYYDALSTAIDIAIVNGSNATIEWSAGDSLPKEIVEKIINNPGITIHFTYTYDGVDYDLMLNSTNLSKIYREDIPWYGPLCLAACSGKYSENGYLVKEGDTLSAIAAMLNTTVDALMARNPEIADPDLIYVGQTIY